jgi:carboxyl-terminal processing protease
MALTSCGAIGLHYRIMTTDGNSYYPFVVGLDRGKPAARKGIRPHDKIIEIDGVSTLNKSFSEIAQVFCGKPGEEVLVKARRINKILTFRLIRAPR